jgi:hypothetical protein
MDFRALPPQRRQGHAGPDIIYEGEILDLLGQLRRDKAAETNAQSSSPRPWPLDELKRLIVRADFGWSSFMAARPPGLGRQRQCLELLACRAKTAELVD